jgi:hypothetical protein
MHLNINDDIQSNAPTLLQLQELIPSLEVDQFAILSQNDENYLQAYREKETCILEFREGSENDHYTCLDQLSNPNDMLGVFIKYLNNDPSWKSSLNWDRVLLDDDEESKAEIEVKFDEQEEDCWTCTSFAFKSAHSPARLSLFSRSKPDESYITKVTDVLGNIEGLISKACVLILQNYSYEHFHELGVKEDLLLKEETPDAMSKVVKLVEVSFCDQDCEEYELSFSAPWDDYHSFDVEFKNQEAISCAVNG